MMKKPRNMTEVKESNGWWILNAVRSRLIFLLRMEKDQLQTSAEVNEFENEKEIRKSLEKPLLFLPSIYSKK